MQNKGDEFMLLSAINPVAIDIGPIHVHWYGLILGMATVFGLLLALWEAKRIKMDPDIIMDLAIYAVPAAIVGARAYYVFFQWDYYSQNPSEIIAIWHGGLAIHGALIGSVAAGYVFARIKGISFFKLADITAPSILLGQAIGRWGNFMNQEAHGGPVDLEFLQSMRLPQFIIDQMNINGVYYHPTFLYESTWNIIGVILLLWLRSKNPLRGIVFFSYLTWYSIGRFFIEGLRTDSLAFTGPDWAVSLLSLLWSPMQLFFEPGVMVYGNIRIAQLIGLFLIILSLSAIAYIKYGPKDPVRYNE